MATGSRRSSVKRAEAISDKPASSLRASSLKGGMPASTKFRRKIHPASDDSAKDENLQSLRPPNELRAYLAYIFAEQRSRRRSGSEVQRVLTPKGHKLW